MTTRASATRRAVYHREHFWGNVQGRCPSHAAVRSCTSCSMCNMRACWWCLYALPIESTRQQFRTSRSGYVRPVALLWSQRCAWSLKRHVWHRILEWSSSLRKQAYTAVKLSFSRYFRRRRRCSWGPTILDVAPFRHCKIIPPITTRWSHYFVIESAGAF